jgi:Family of unknown function (DUF6496)
MGIFQNLVDGIYQKAAIRKEIEKNNADLKIYQAAEAKNKPSGIDIVNKVSPVTAMPKPKPSPMSTMMPSRRTMVSYKKGTDRVPKDGPAILHKGEAVLNKKDAKRHRASKRVSGALGGKKAKSKVEKTMHEFKVGTLHSGSKKGPKVKNRKQAVAIALSQARKEA